MEYYFGTIPSYFFPKPILEPKELVKGSKDTLFFAYATKLERFKELQRVKELQYDRSRFHTSGSFPVPYHTLPSSDQWGSLRLACSTESDRGDHRHRRRRKPLQSRRFHFVY